MKKMSNHKPEAKVSAFLSEPFAADDARMEGIRQRAHAEYQRRILAGPARKKAKTKSLFRRAMVFCAVIIGLMIGSFAYSVLMPVTVSNANNIVRKASIWINNTFRLGFEFSQPVDDDEKFVAFEDGTHYFSSVEEAAKELQTQLYDIDATIASLTLNYIEATTYNNQIESITINYTKDHSSLFIYLKRMKASNVYSNGDNIFTVTAPVGEITAWEVSNGIRAMMFSNDWEIQLKADMAKEIAIMLIQSLHNVN